MFRVGAVIATQDSCAPHTDPPTTPANGGEGTMSISDLILGVRLSQLNVLFAQSGFSFQAALELRGTLPRMAAITGFLVPASRA